MNITYVSALYNIYNSPNVSDRLIKDVQILLQQPIRLILFVDEYYQELLKPLEKCDSIKIIYFPIENLTIYNLIIKNKEKLHLPEYRSIEKDTHEYMALMNTKIEFLCNAYPYSNDPYIAWIDAGISKLFKHKKESFQRLSNLHIKNVDTILIPGGYYKFIDFYYLFNDVWWVFLGTFFICNKNFISEFYSYSVESIHKFLSYNYIVWEVNIWIYILSFYPKTFIWYHSDHNDYIPIIPQEYCHINQI